MFTYSKWFSVFTVAALAFSSGSVHANVMKWQVPLDLLEMKRSAKKISSVSPLRVRTDCPNLAGNWAGSCYSEGGDEVDGALQIAQIGCQEIRLGSHTISLGGIDVFRGEEGNLIDTAMSDWNTGLTGFDIRWQSSGREINQPTYYSSSTRVTFELVGSTLVSRVDGLASEERSGQTHEWTFRRSCEYNRTN